MKLGALKADIRAAPKVRVWFNLANKYPIKVPVEKGELLAQLDLAFPGGKAVETGLCLNGEGFLCPDSDVP